MLRLIGNSVLLQPLDAEVQVSASGLTLVNHYKKPTLKFRVLAVGPGAFRYRKGKRKAFIVPEVEVGDFVICRAILDSSIVKHSLDDGTGRVIVEAESIQMKWRE
jgi:co-chaperonin GroES (HSP10)